MIPKNHPRYQSLLQRHKIEEGLKRGIVTPTGMIAQGRGEAFDYLLGEKTTKEAREQIEAAAAKLTIAKHPVLSVNGNTIALCAKEIVSLSKTISAPIEINLFYRTKKRIALIEKEFKKFGIKALGVKPAKKIPGLKSNRGKADEKGIWTADVVLVMLEDGDRTEMLRKMGKYVIAIDLNPMSRTAKKANLTIVDNVIRAIPLLEKNAQRFKNKGKKWLERRVKKMNNSKMLQITIKRMRKRI